MGGLPPLGYDVEDRKLLVNTTEATTVRHIFQRYAALRSVHALKDELDAGGIRSKARTDRLGQATGAQPISRGALYRMLQNRLYRGEIVHKGSAYPGQHAAIIGPELWADVQAAMVENRSERVRATGATAPSLLSGLTYDGAGERMSPSHTNKHGTRYRYYVSHSLIQRGRTKASETACRIPAADLEGIVERRICALLRDEAAIYETISPTAADVASRKVLLDAAASLAERWSSLPPGERRAMLQALIGRITVRAGMVDITVRLPALVGIIKPDLEPVGRTLTPTMPETVLSVPTQLKRTGTETKLLVQGKIEPKPPVPDRSLVRLLAQAHRFARMVMNSQGKRMGELAAEAGVNSSYFSRVFRLGFLAPEITRAILQGRQPPELTGNKLMLTGKLAAAWSEQRRQLGFR